MDQLQAALSRKTQPNDDGVGDTSSTCHGVRQNVDVRRNMDHQCYHILRFYLRHGPLNLDVEAYLMLVDGRWAPLH